MTGGGRAEDRPASVGHGHFITLEGPDGSGKSTQAERLAARLRAAGYAVTLTREPGGTPLGERVRQILLHATELDLAPAADALLFNAARAQQVAQVIRPALERGEVVVCDRFSDSTLAYQGYGSGQSQAALRAVEAFAIGDVRPELTILFDLPTEIGLARRREAADGDRFETAFDVAFHRRVRDGYLTLAAAEPGRFVVVDADGELETVEVRVVQAVGRLLPDLAARAQGRPAGGTVGAAPSDGPRQQDVRIPR